MTQEDIVKEVQEYKDAIRYLMRVYLISTTLTNSEFARAVGINHHTIISFDRGSYKTQLANVNKIEAYICSKLEGSSDIIAERIQMGRKK